MSKSIKLKDNNCIDSSGIVHNKNNLKNILNNILKYNLTKVKTLDWGTDFNNITQAGYYMYNGWYNTSATTGGNRPSDSYCMGFMIVMVNETWNNITQILFVDSANVGIKYRLYRDGAWQKWRTVAVT